MYKLVIIDDEPRIRRGISHCMPWEQMGITIAGEAANGVEALEVIRSVRPELVITDIRMPDMDGLDMISMVRREGISSHFIVISGYAEFEYAQRALRYGVSDYILKPVEEEKLYQSVLNCLRQLGGGEQETVGETVAEDSQKHFIIRKALRIMENEYMNNLSLASVAERVGVHPNYLSSLFSKHEGESFGNILLHLRMSKARDLMDVTSMKVYEIAERVGYRDFRWFSKLFRQVYGVTPMKYRSGKTQKTEDN